jgi:hypothetical protein
MDLSRQTADEPVIELRLVAEEREAPTLPEITNFLYDFNLIYEVGRLATDPEYDSFHFSRYIYFRKGRPLHDRDRLIVRQLRQESPLLLIAEIAAAGGTGFGAVWAVIQTIEKISNWRLNREKLKEEVAKLRRENAAGKQPATVIEEEQAIMRFSRREAQPVLDQLGNRIADSSVRVQELKVTVFRRVTRTSEGRSNRVS